MIHKLAVVHPDAQIGKNVTIEPFSMVDKNTIIGDGSWIGPNASVMSGARMGKNCKIFPGAVVSAIPQDLKFAGEDSTTEIGDNVTIRECVTINRGTKAKNKTIIGNNTLLMAYVHIAHDCIVGNNCVIVNYTGFAGEVEVGDFAIVSGATVVHQFVRIGMHCIIGGGSKVRVDVPPFVKADREPLSYVGINSVGLRRRQFSPESISSIQEMYRFIYQHNLNISQALDKIENEIPQSGERDEILRFFRSSSRGFIKRPS